MTQDASQEHQVPSKMLLVGEGRMSPRQQRLVLLSRAVAYNLADVGHADAFSMECPSLILGSKPNLREPRQGMPHASWATTRVC